MAILLGVVEIVDFCGRICRLRRASLCVLGGFSPIATCAYMYHPPPPALGVKGGLALVTPSLVQERRSWRSPDSPQCTGGGAGVAAGSRPTQSWAWD